MYKKTEETYSLDIKDKLVLTYESGEIRVLINNEIKVNPSDIAINVVSHGVTSITDGKPKRRIDLMNIRCVVEE